MARTRLTARGSGKVLEVDDESVDFWLERGFRREDEQAKPAAKKATAKKASSSKTSK